MPLTARQQCADVRKWWRDQGMEPREGQSVKERLVLLEFLMAGHERRHEVMDAVWDSRDEDEAAERVHRLLVLRV